MVKGLINIYFAHRLDNLFSISVPHHLRTDFDTDQPPDGSAEHPAHHLRADVRAVARADHGDAHHAAHVDCAVSRIFPDSENACPC